MATTAVASKLVDIVNVTLVKEGSIRYAKRFITNPKDAAGTAADSLGGADREKVLIICVDIKNRATSMSVIPKSVSMVSIGTPNSSYSTARLQDAGEIIGIDMLDHIIIGDDRYLSFKRTGADVMTALQRLEAFLDELQEPVEQTRFTVENEGQADWVLRKIGRCDRRVAEIQEVANREVRKIQDWMKAEQEKEFESVLFFTGLLDDAFANVRMTDNSVLGVVGIT